MANKLNKRKTFDLDFRDVYLKNKDTPVEYWSDKDVETYNKLEEDYKAQEQKIKEKYQAQRDWGSDRGFFIDKIAKARLPILRKMNVIKSKLNEHEKTQVDTMVNMFGIKYNLTDVRVYLIVKEFLRNYIINNRIQHEMMSSAMVRTEYFGQDERKLPNVLLKSKHDYSKLYMETIKLLDTMTKDDVLVDNEVKTSQTLRDVFLSKIPKTKARVIDIPTE